MEKSGHLKNRHASMLNTKKNKSSNIHLLDDIYLHIQLWREIMRDIHMNLSNYVKPKGILKGSKIHFCILEKI